MNLTGTVTEKDLSQAKDYFEKAAALDNADALYGLGKLYLSNDLLVVEKEICLLNLYRTMERRVNGNAHIRCEAGENSEMTSKDYLSLLPKIESAEMMFSASRSRTVITGSVSRSKNAPSQSQQMIESPLMTPEELKSMPKGQYVVIKTGFHPMKVKLKLFF